MLQDIEVVVNYDFPVGTNGIESYVHRIGRTARGNATGTTHHSPLHLAERKKIPLNMNTALMNNFGMTIQSHNLP